MSNPPINAVGNELLITVSPGIYAQPSEIVVNLPNPATQAVGTSLTVLVNAFDIINYSTLDPRSVRVHCPNGVTFSDKTTDYVMHTDGASFTVTVANATTWAKGYTVIHGANNIQNEDMVAYSANISSFVVSSYKTTGDIYVLGSTIFHGYVYGLNASPPIYALSTNYLSTGTITTGNLLITNLSSIVTRANTFTAGSNFGTNTLGTINPRTNTLSTNLIYGSTMNLSSLNFIDTKYGTSNVYLSSVNSALQIGDGVFSSIYVT